MLVRFHLKFNYVCFSVEAEFRLKTTPAHNKSRLHWRDGSKMVDEALIVFNVFVLSALMTHEA